jgi:glycosyltransferase involved in cell wall biosynthesis
MYLSVIVPVFNEEGACANLHREILEMCLRMGSGFRVQGTEEELISLNENNITPSPNPEPRTLTPAFEIIFVNDGSSDKTVEVLKTLSPIKIVNLRKNFGQTAAMDAGIKAATGRYIATLDGDGQNNPADIPKLIAKLESEDLDVVSGWRKNRQDTKSKRYSSLAAAFVRKTLINDGIHDSGCSLKVYKRECFEHVHLYGEMHRFIPAVLKIKGFKIGEEVVDHRARTTGKTKYNWKRGVKGILDMCAVAFWQKYATRPLHMFGGAGVVLMFVSVISGLIAIYKKLFRFQDLSNSAMTELSMFGFFMGMVLLCFGLLSDMLMKTYYDATNDVPYDVKEVVEK